MAPEFHLDVGGTPGLAIRGSCRVVDEGGPRRLSERTDLVPAAYDFIGLALSCTVQKRDDFGRLDVALRGPDGTLIATAETAAPFGSLRVRSAGPWGDADASRGPSRLFLLPDDPGFRFGRPPAGTPVPPFRSPPVPPLSGFAVPPCPDPIAHPRQPEESTTRSRRVLVVEDEALTSLMIEDTLKAAGYIVVGPVATIRDALGPHLERIPISWNIEYPAFAK